MEQLVDRPSAHDGAHLDTPDALQREQFTISDLTEEFGVTARALRFYEDEGLIAPARVGLSRVYSKRDRARLAWILRAKNVGFSLTEIKEMIDLYDLGDGRVEQRRHPPRRAFEHGSKQVAATAITVVPPDQLIEHIAITGDHPFEDRSGHD